MTAAEEIAEIEYRTQERLGILCGDCEPTADQKRAARTEAVRDVEGIGLNDLRERRENGYFNG